MRCEGCERTASKALMRLDGVVEATADHTAEQVQVSFDPDQVGEADLRRVLTNAGYVAA
jgi:copper chaperone